MIKSVKKILTVVALCLMTVSATAWEPKNKQVDALIAYAPGSGNELILRAVAAQVEKNTGVKFTVVHKPGAGGTVGTTIFKTLPADGQNICVVSTLAIGAMDKSIAEFREKKPYDVDSFEHVIQLGYTAGVIIAHPSDRVNNPKQLVDALLNERTRLGHSGGGGRFVFETLASKIQLDTKNKFFGRVEYKGPAQTITDVAGGHIRFGVVPVSVALPFHKNGQIKIVGITDPIAQLPDIQTFSSAVPGYTSAPLAWGLMLPKGTKPEVLEWYRKEFTAALRAPEVKKWFEDNLIQVDEKLLDSTAYTAYLKKIDKDLQYVVDSVIKIDQVKN